MAIYQNDSGIVLTVQLIGADNLPINISLANQVYILFTRPNDTTFQVDGSFATDGKDGIVQYITQTGDLNIVGTWRMQVEVLLPGDVYHSDINMFKVLENIR
jgi:hypothetical protein